MFPFFLATLFEFWWICWCHWLPYYQKHHLHLHTWKYLNRTVCIICQNLVVWLITVMSYWERCHLKSPASRLFAEPFVQVQMKENFKAPRHWPLCGEFLAQKPVTRKIFPINDVTSYISLCRMDSNFSTATVQLFLHAACYKKQNDF